MVQNSCWSMIIIDDEDDKKWNMAWDGHNQRVSRVFVAIQLPQICVQDEEEPKWHLLRHCRCLALEEESSRSFKDAWCQSEQGHRCCHWPASSGKSSKTSLSPWTWIIWVDKKRDQTGKHSFEISRVVFLLLCFRRGCQTWSWHWQRLCR